MPYFDAEQVALDYLEAQGLGTKGTDLFRGPTLEPEKGRVPRDATFLVAHDGPMAQRYMGTARKAWVRAQVEILIRSSPENREAGRNRALAVLDAFKNDSSLDIVGCQILESAPRYLERDRLNNHLWLVKVELWDVS